jgi:putative transposase
MEGHLMPDHVHMSLLIPPKYSVTKVVGFIKGKRIPFRSQGLFSGRKRNFTGQNFWARGLYVYPLGRGEKAVGEYTKKIGTNDRRPDQLNY